MDITKELLEISSSENFGANLSREIKDEQEELAKNIPIEFGKIMDGQIFL